MEVGLVLCAARKSFSRSEGEEFGGERGGEGMGALCWAGSAMGWVRFFFAMGGWVWRMGVCFLLFFFEMG